MIFLLSQCTLRDFCRYPNETYGPEIDFSTIQRIRNYGKNYDGDCFVPYVEQCR